MMLALFAGVSGLRTHQIRMDVIGNNIANVNTIGYKASRVTFSEAFVQLTQGATRPSSTLGGVNPTQVGTGVKVGGVDQLFSQGSLETTGQPLDLAIQGSGLFVLSNGARRVYTRAGGFQLDAIGRLVAPGSGYLLQGINADSFGNFSSGSSIGDIQVRVGDKSPAQQTSEITLTGNLDNSAAVGTVHNMSITVYDTAGAAHNLLIAFTNTGVGQWTWSASTPNAAVSPAGTGTVSFNSNGTLAGFTYPGGGSTITLTPPGGTAVNIAINPGTVNGIDGLVGFSNASNAVVNRQNGYPAGDLVNITVDTRGVITGFFTNGVTRSMAQIALATFNNPSGLIRGGNNVYEESPNSGIGIVGFAGTTTSSSFTPGALETSNVDISQEFTNMIVTQRGFQANARVITTADEMLTELVNLKR